MNDHDLRIPKRENEVTLWVHPEGRVIGTIFLSYRDESMRTIEPVEVLNQETRFLVLRGGDDSDVRFYSKAAIVRVDYHESALPDDANLSLLRCRLHMMDGALIDGTIRRFLPPDNARLYDYLNLVDERFIKVHVDDGEVCLVNKAYIVRVESR